MKRQIQTLIGFALLLALGSPTVALASKGRGWLGFDCGASASVGLPNPINVSLDCKQGRRLGLSVGGGGFWLPVNEPQLQLEGSYGSANVEGRARWYPFNEDFFIGGALGYQAIWVRGGMKQLMIFGDTQAEFSTYRAYATPHVGWSWILRDRLELGLELGWMIPIAPSTHISDDGPGTVVNLLMFRYLNLDMLAGDNAQKLGDTGLPYVTVRIGWNF
jgi:hypothetical protein